MDGSEPPPRPAVLCRSPSSTPSRGRAGCQGQLAAATWKRPVAHLCPPCEIGGGPQSLPEPGSKIPLTRGKRFPVRESASRPGGHGTDLQLPVDGEVHPLVVEAEQALDLGALRDRGGIAPDEILQQTVPAAKRPVDRDP